MKAILSAEQIEAAIESLADQVARNVPEKLAIVGIRSRGDEVAERLCRKLTARGISHEFGVLDISLYRDDYEHLHENPMLQHSEIAFAVDGARILLVDDVLFTGRTIRAALNAICDYGRPSQIELAVLIDRGHREMPISPEYVGVHLDTKRTDHVLVSLMKSDGRDLVEIRTLS